MDYQSFIAEQLKQLNLSELQDIMNETAKSSNGIFSGMSIEDVIYSALNGQPLFNSQVIISSMMDLFLYEIKSSLLLGIELVLICIVTGLLTNLSNSFGEKTVSNLGIIVCSCFVIALCLKNFSFTYDLCADSLHTMTLTMQLLLPILIPLLVSMGGFTTGSILNPVIVGSVTMFNTVLQKFILPAIFISSIFILINSMTDRDYVHKLAVFIRGIATFATGLCVTFFAGLTVIQGFVSKSTDGILINTARYSINNFVPIVGGFAADSIDMVLSCMGIIKNGISIFGVILIIVLLAIPLIKILAIAFLYKITAIVIEPIGNKQISNCINEMGNSVISMAVVMFLGALMFLIFLTIIIGIGGGSLIR